MYLQLRLLQFLKAVKKETFAKILLGLCIMAFSVTRAYAMARGASAVLLQEDIGRISLFLAIAVASIVLKGILIKYNEIYSKKTACKAKAGIRRELVDKLQRLGPQYQANKRSGQTQSLITDGVEALESFLIYYIPQIFIALVTVSILVVYIMRIDLTVGVIILVSVICAVVGPHISRIHFQDSTTEYWKAYAVLNSQYIDTMQGMDTLKAFNSSHHKGDELAGNCWDFYRKQLRTTANSLVDSAFVVFCMGIGTSFTVGLAAYHAASGQVDVIGLLSILFLIPECFKPITEMNSFWHSSYLGFSVADQFFEIIDEPVIVVEKENAVETGLDNGLPNIRMQDIRFRYKRGREDVLRNVDIDIHTGQQIAVAGKSGSGKSTLVNVLLRFYDFDSGRVLYNGVDIRDYSLEYLRSKISVVFQDTYLFYGTVRENIAMAKLDAGIEEIIAAAKTANIHEFISSLPDGYQTVVGERGLNLSGGERQRIAVARAVLKDAPFLILDEATASVDAENEKDIQLALERLMRNKTALVIAHRLSTIRDADRIIVLEDGKVCESGTHEELLALNSVYARLISAQNMTKAVSYEK
ncbi:MAG: ABC transporter ATP-binding protein [Peptococcaceae bacterium]